ncbi:hypothetical protein J3A83DRAFT_3811153 [Scleroderma citrinum]
MEVVIVIVAMIRHNIFEVNDFNLIGPVTTYPTTDTTNIFISYSITTFYEFLLFSLALWAVIQCHGCPSFANWTRAHSLRAILIEGNLTYFLVSLLYTISYWVISLTLPVGFQIHSKTTILTIL